MKPNHRIIMALTMLLLLSPLTYAQTWNEQAKIVASDRQADDIFGSYNGASIYGDYAVVGAERADLPGKTNAGAAYVYKRDANCNWIQIQKLTADIPEAYDYFGFSVAIYDDFMVIGARNDDRDASNSNPLNNAGSAYIFQNIGGTWTQTQKISAADREVGAAFGHDVDITARRIIVGAWGDDQDLVNPYIINSGAAYIFEYNGFNWTQTQKLVASDRGQHDWFGGTVAISGNYAVVGAHLEDHDATGGATLNNSGSAYVFENPGTGWTQVNKLVSTDRGANEFFGCSVDIDGNFVIVGAYSDHQDENGGSPLVAAGSAFIFKRDNGTGTWPVDDKIDASDRATADRFGYAVSISKGTAAVGAWFEAHDPNGGNTQNYAGSAYIYEYNTAGWNQTQKVVASDRSTDDRFGSSVSLFYDRLLVGAFQEDEDVNGGTTLTNSGSAYVFELNSPADQPTVTASTTSFCPGSPVTLSISSGNLNDASLWQWHIGSCTGPVVGTGNSIVVSPTSTVTYYVNGVGGCVPPGLCGSITLTPNSSSSWHQTTANTIAGDITNDVITDNAGNVYVTGTFNNQTTLVGGGNPDITINTGVGNQLASYVAKYNPCGDLLWEAHTFGCKDNEGRSIILDEQNGIVYTTGNFVSNLRFVTSTACGSTPTTIYASGGPTGYVAAFKMANGCEISLDPVNQNNFTSCEAITINEDNGHIFVGGNTSPNFNNTPHTSFVHKYIPSSTGIGPVVADITSFAGNYNNQINDMDFDEQNYLLWIIGDFEKKVEFFPGSGIIDVANPFTVNQDAFLLGYKDTPGGFLTYTNRRGNTEGFMSGEGIAVDPQTGNPYWTGTYRESVAPPFQFGGINALPAFSTNTAYMIGYDLNSGNGWSRYGVVPFSHAEGKSVAFRDDYIYYVGNFMRGDINLQNIGTYPYVAASPFLANNHVFIAAYKTNGAGVWANVTTDPGANTAVHQAESITTDANGHVFAVGEYIKQMDYFSTPGSPQLVYSGNGYNGFILRGETTNGDLFVTPPSDEPQTATSDSPMQGISGTVVPNPTHGPVVYTIDNFDQFNTYTITVFDLLGQVIFELTADRATVNFDLSDQPEGVYLLKLSGGSETSFAKIVKTN